MTPFEEDFMFNATLPALRLCNRPGCRLQPFLFVTPRGLSDRDRRVYGGSAWFWQQRQLVPALSHVPGTPELSNKPMSSLPTHLPFFHYIHLMGLQHILIFCLLASKGTQLLLWDGSM